MLYENFRVLRLAPVGFCSNSRQGRTARAQVWRRAILAVGMPLVLAIPAPVHSQRDAEYAAARATGRIGEKADGYLGIVGRGTPMLGRVVNDINIKRRALYTERAQLKHVTLEKYAFLLGCVLIARTVRREKYQTPDGKWRTRGRTLPRRDPRCP